MSWFDVFIEELQDTFYDNIWDYEVNKKQNYVKLTLSDPTEYISMLIKFTGLDRPYHVAIIKAKKSDELVKGEKWDEVLVDEKYSERAGERRVKVRRVVVKEKYPQLKRYKGYEVVYEMLNDDSLSVFKLEALLQVVDMIITVAESKQTAP